MQDQNLISANLNLRQRHIVVNFDLAAHSEHKRQARPTEKPASLIEADASGVSAQSPSQGRGRGLHFIDFADATAAILLRLPEIIRNEVGGLRPS
ncbi:hypothetical protein [Bradyrhizobium symbiodeficiens]|uniref:hypothetical protein n=1 Tax=Bradyrhizobium symbiodeficiens TaxID=1404367 RepID=UPI00140FF0C4|nr:hypothetical protein [Bradyrhizobium symbiodeficiens]QIO98800.1 hypothetical protein HAU86_02785 [Bradyrhizobium symbiodeficiens]